MYYYFFAHWPTIYPYDKLILRTYIQGKTTVSKGGLLGKMQVVQLVTEMLRHKTRPSLELTQRVQVGLDQQTTQESFYYVGCYEGFLNDSENVRKNELKCYYRALALLKKKTKKRTNFNRAVLLLTHGIQYKTWWNRTDAPLNEDYRKLLETVLARLKFNPLDIEGTDLYLEVMMSLNRTNEIPRGSCIRMLHDLDKTSGSVRRAHVKMLLKHVADQDARVTDMKLIDQITAYMDTIDLLARPAYFEFPAHEILPLHLVDALRKHVVEDVLNIRSYTPVAGMDYVRIKDALGAFTELHTDYGNVVVERQAVAKEDAGKVRTVWVALCDVSPRMSCLQFVNRPKKEGCRKGDVFVFDLAEAHWATKQRVGKRRFSIDFRILVS
jgi:hypothetical protein